MECLQQYSNPREVHYLPESIQRKEETQDKQCWQMKFSTVSWFLIPSLAEWVDFSHQFQTQIANLVVDIKIRIRLLVAVMLSSKMSVVLAVVLIEIRNRVKETGYHLSIIDEIRIVHRTQFSLQYRLNQSLGWITCCTVHLRGIKTMLTRKRNQTTIKKTLLTKSSVIRAQITRQMRKSVSVWKNAIGQTTEKKEKKIIVTPKRKHLLLLRSHLMDHS